MNTPLAWDDFMASIGYSRRQAQDELVALISKTLYSKGYLLGRAGTGTGKSLASVIPSVAYAHALEGVGPVLVSTATKALQGQYYLKDLPKMAEHYKVPRANDPLSANAGKHKMAFSILKGKRNYLCRERLSPLATHPMPIPVEIIKRLNGLPATHEGDVSTLGLTRPQEIALTTNTDDCPGRNECLWAEDEEGKLACYYEKAKAKARDADVVIVNHALIAAHAKIKAATDGAISLLPGWAVLVLDECHKMTGYMQNALGWSASQVRLAKWADSCIDDDEQKATFKKSASDFFSNVLVYDHEDKKNEQQIMDRKILESDGQLRWMIEVIEDWLEFWIDEASEDRNNNEIRKRARRTANLLADLAVALNPDGRDNFWVEVDKQNNKILYYKPSEDKTADFMREHLWPESPAILLSATTPAPETLGLPENTEEFDADSPFNYREQSRLFISSLDGAAPYDFHERELWEQRRHNEMLKLVAASDGRALLLFTSWADLNKAHDILAPRFMQAGVKILKQDKDNESERDRLAREFKEDERSVLFGTESFFEGVDIPGRSCQLVIISKLPFPAMIDNTRGGKLDFRKEMLPEMRMKLVQAAGRLIRTHEDRGLVAVLDARLRSKPYGKNILANVNPFNEMARVPNLQAAMDYLESLEDA